MYVHVDQAVFERKPFLGVLLGVVGLTIWAIAAGIGYREYRGYGNVPAAVDVRTIQPPSIGKWVKLDQPLRVDCDSALQERRSPPESWILGKVNQTFIAASIPDTQRKLLLVYRGDVTSQQCDSIQVPLVGVLEEVNSRRKNYLRLPAEIDVQLSVGDGPVRTRKLLLASLFMPVLSIYIFFVFWPKWRNEVRRREDPLSAIAGRQ